MSKQLELIDRYISAYNTFDIEGMLALVSDDVRFENHSGEQLTAATDGKEALRQLAEQSSALFSERTQRVTSLHINGDSATASIAFHAVLAADVPGGPAAGTVLDLKGQSEFEFSGGLIRRIVDRS